MQTIETSRFTNNTLSVRRLVPLEEKTIAAWNVLVWMMRTSTAKWPDRQAFTYALGHAYAMRVRCGLTGYGTQASVEIIFEWIRPELVQDPGYPEEVRTIMDQVLYHPNLTEEGLEEARYLIGARLRRQQEDPDTVAVLQALQAVGEGTSLAIPISGKEEWLEQVTLHDVQRLWQQLADTPASLYAVGELEPATIDFLDRIVQSTPCQKAGPVLAARSPLTVACTRDISQTSLVQGYATGVSLQDPLAPALLVCSSILGSGQKSLLFEEIRERHSWCYSISSSLIRYDGLLLISAGTRSEYLEDLQAEIRRQIDRICQDDYPQSFFDAAILELTDNICSRKDFPASMIESAFQQDLMDRHRSEEEQIRRLQAVTRQDVQKVAGQLQLVVTSIVQEEE